MYMKTRISLSTSALALTFALASSGAMAAFTLNPNGQNSFEDDFYELLNNVDNSFDVPAPPGTGLPTMTTGDTLRGIFDFPIINGFPAGDPELVGIFEIEILSAVATGNTSPQGLPLYDFTFGAVTAGNALLDGSISDGQTAVWIYNPNTGDDFPILDGGIGGDACDTMAECEALVSGAPGGGNASLWATFGFTGDSDEVWAANEAPNIPDAFQTVSITTNIGGFSMALSNIINNTGFDILPHMYDCTVFDCGSGDNMIDWSGTGEVGGTEEIHAGPNHTYGDGVFPYSVGGDIQVRIDTQAVPAPVTLALLGVGLLGMGVTRRRKRNA
jgi:hypothetical protein